MRYGPLFLTLELGGGKWPDSHPNSLMPRKAALDISIGEVLGVCLMVGVDSTEISLILGGFERRSFSPYLY